MRIKREIIEKGMKVETEREGLMVGRVKIGEERWRLVGVYVRKEEMGGMLQELEK